MHAPVLQSAHKCEVLSLTNSKSMIGAKLKNGSRDPDHAN